MVTAPDGQRPNPAPEPVERIAEADGQPMDLVHGA
jgi:hypothetical protein